MKWPIHIKLASHYFVTYVLTLHFYNNYGSIVVPSGVDPTRVAPPVCRGAVLHEERGVAMGNLVFIQGQSAAAI